MDMRDMSENFQDLSLNGVDIWTLVRKTCFT